MLRKGKPVANAAIELCETPLTMFQKTPCGSATVTRTATTGPDGGFRLADVPVGSFGFAVKPGAQWVILIGSSCCSELEAGGTYDVGSIAVD